jgi:hypothetical protein
VSNNVSSDGHNHPTPLFPKPIRPYEPYTDFEAKFAELKAEGLHMAYGRCRDFCAIDVLDDNPSVNLHGPFCESVTAGSADGLTAEGRPVSLFLELAGSYAHGIYDEASWPAVRGASDAWVRLTLTESFVEDGRRYEYDHQIYVRSGDARSVAAALVYLADQLDLPGGSIRGSLDRRRGSHA